MKKLLAGVGTLIFTTGVQFALPQLGYAQEVVRVGSVVSTSGPASLLGDSQLKVLKLYAEKMNAAGGINGKKIEIVAYDDASDAGKANQFAKRLIENDKVDLIVGASTSGSTLAMLPLAQKSGVPLISMAAAVGIVEPVKKWVFKMAHSDRQAVERVFEEMKQKGIAKIGVLTETSGFGQSGRKEIQAAAPRYGITILSDETYTLKDNDVSAQLTKMRDAAGMQAVYIFGLGQGPAVAVKNMEQLQIKLPTYHSNGVSSREFIRLSGTAAEGNYIPASSILVPASLPDGDPQKQVALDFVKTYRAQYPNDEISYYSGLAYDGFMIAMNAVKAAGSTDKEKVRTAIENTRNYVGVTGTYNMSATDHMGLQTKSLWMFQVKGKDFILPKN